MPSIAQIGALLAAAEQLAIVTSIVDANRAVLISAGGVPGPLGTIEMPRPPSQHDVFTASDRCDFVRAPIYCKRDIIHQPPKVLPRETIRLEPNIVDLPVPPVDQCAAPTSKPMDLKNPIQPPWAVLPWPKTAQTVQKVKPPGCANDVSCKGTMLDCFV